MANKKHEAAYRPILKKAWKIVRTRKELWVLGIFAGFVNTGAVLEVAFRVSQPAESNSSLQKLFAENIIPGFDAWRLWFVQFGVIETWRAILVGLIILAVIIALVALAVCSQHGLVKGTLSRSRQKTMDLLKLPKRACWKILIVDIMTKILVAIMLAVSTIPLALLSSQIFANIAASFVVLLLFIAIMVTLSMLSILTIASIAHRGHSLHEALVEAWGIFRRHPLATFETALLVFVIHLLGGIITFMIIMVLWIPYLIAYLAAVLTTTTALTAIVSLMTAGIMLLVVLIAGGILTAFQYAVWSLIYQKLRGKGFLPKVHRFRKTFRIV